MSLTHVLESARFRPSFEQLVRWWSSASPETRYRLLCAAHAKDPQAPSVTIVLAAALVAEEAQGTVETREG